MSMITVVVFAPLLILAGSLVMATLVMADLSDRRRARTAGPGLPVERPRAEEFELPRAA